MFIVVDGIDGAGKTTCVEMINSLIYRSLTLHFPNYDSPWGKLIKQYLMCKLKMTPDVQFLTYLADIANSQHRIRRYLATGGTVIADRYMSSTYAFQVANGVSEDWALSTIASSNMHTPDLEFLIDTDPVVANERMKEKGLDVHERNLDFQRKVAENFRQLTSYRTLAVQWVIIDGNKTKEEVCDQIRRFLG